MKFAITGSSGLVGSALCEQWAREKNEVRKLVRHASAGAGEVVGNLAAGKVDVNALEGVDGVVHLAGENIAAGRWTAAQKERIRTSRVEGTHVLATALAGMKRKPSVLVCASAIGFYGERGAQACDESTPVGTKFLAEVCEQWENATIPAREAGIRVVNLRIGVVLSRRGGALTKMLTPFRLGLGGRIGSGQQVWSWIALDDLVGAISHCLATSSLAGPVNAVAPQAVTNSEFTRILGKVLRRPTFMPMPGFAARLALGEMADELLLASTRVVPSRLLGSGFVFRYAELETALRHVLA